MAQRWTNNVYRGLDSIYAFMSTELEACQASFLECDCDSCKCRFPDPDYEGQSCEGEDGCLCGGEPYAKQCKGCQAQHDLAKALSWIGEQMGKHHDPDRESR